MHINFFQVLSLSPTSRQSHRLKAALRWNLNSKTKSATATTLLIAFIDSLTLQPEEKKSKIILEPRALEHKFRWWRKINEARFIKRPFFSGNKIKNETKTKIKSAGWNNAFSYCLFLFIAGGFFPIVICWYAFVYWICAMPIQWAFF